MATVAEQVLDAPVQSKKTLGLMTAFKSPHLTLLLTSRLMRSFAPIVGVALSVMGSACQDRSCSWPVTAKLVCDQPSRLFLLPLKDFAEKALGGSGVAPALYEDFQAISILIDRTP